jgi:ketosteroid isomerase-like protein
LFLRGDPEGRALFAPDAVLHVPGRSRVAGTFAGVDRIDEYQRSLRDLTDGDLQIDLEDVSIDGAEVFVRQHVTASRNGRALEDHQFVRFAMDEGQVRKAWVYPSDLQYHDEFWGGARRPLFTAEDREILASAFREARPQTASSSGVLALILAMVGAFLAITAYNVLHDWRPPAEATVSTQSVTTLRHMTLNGTPGSVRWTIETATVGGLGVSGASEGTAVVLLPLPESACGELAAALGSECTSGEIQIGTPVELAWSSPQQVSSDGNWIAGASLDVAPLGAEPNTIGVALFSRTTSQPSLCFSSPGEEVRLIVTQGAQEWRHRFEGDEPAAACGSAIRLIVGSDGVGEPPTFELRSVDDLSLSARGPRANLQGLSGKIVTSPGGATAFASPAVLSLAADTSEPLAASLKLGAGVESLVMYSSTTTSALTEDGELIQSRWDRDPGIIVPLLGGFVGVFVVTPLGVAVQGLMATLRRGEKRLLGIWRRWRRADVP